ncbi:VirB4 family type IV secretion/conjugal transfer ATPase [Burkholderia gladioli pv. gladioli]|uniref:Type IV secretion system protein ptlC n=1 Tax=Burkholderia gladioli TaxID=28095 RepID=A0A095G0C0_BURGA|nr:VirB4 family type IV secretion/conjugal transfer ATPase [Burkholderia gladioli]AJW99703.1 type IV secretion system protein ptlC [Burkholderia gladioli]ASD80033.1 VirB4 family type IV secretion/conjugal transfer ATPase [Burkholderia gladioli pv. gladioli]AWY54720.1 VirB4 family type IV secretion/conjugal transfer ATPase [Burkholderia gladioli pv. gladioli]KGC10852.1 type IV secretion system protein ptlC [Burkholderia gladioli]MDJ1160314.1 VirB4 family type IV secretion/conjugal transfer ATPa
MAAQPHLIDVAGREVVLADFVPFSSHVTDHVIRTREGDYLRVWKIAGIAFEAADPGDILVRHEGFNQLVRSLPGGHVGLWSHRLRRRVTDHFATPYGNPFCQELATRYYASFAGYRMMANELYLTVVYRPHRTRLGRLFSQAARRTAGDIRRGEYEALKVMAELAAQVESGLKPWGPVALGVYRNQVRDAKQIHHTQRSVRFSAALEFLGYLVNAAWEPVPVPSGRIAEALPTSRLFFRTEKVEIRMPGATRYAALLDLKDYPEETEPGMLDGLLYGDFEYIETQSFTILDRPTAKEALERQRNQLIAGEDVAVSQVEAMDQALNDLINGDFVLGEYHYSLAVLGDRPDEVARHVAKARTQLADVGFQSALVDLVADAAWFAQLPGNWRYRPREAKLTSRNFCGLASLHNFATGKRDGNPWGEAITIVKTPSGQPLYLNFHATPEKKESADEKALANTQIIGQAGAGKTVLELFLLAMAMKYGVTGVVYDKDRGTEIAIRAVGGRYTVFHRGVPTGLNPFQLEPDEAVLDFWERLVRRLVDTGAPLSARDELDVSRAVREVARMARPLRRLSMVRQLMPNVGENSLHARLTRWCAGGRLGWVLDNPSDLLDFSENHLFGFDDTELLDDPEVSTPVTMYLLHLTGSLIDGRRFIYVMTEFWKRLGDPVFTDFANNKQKTIRKQNGLGIFDTQSPADVLRSPIARALIEQTATFFFLPNPRADYDDYVHGFKLTQAEFNIVRTLGENSRLFLVKQGHHSAIGRLDLGGLGDVLDVLSGTTDNVELLDGIRAEIGDEPAAWLPVFHERLARRRAGGAALNTLTPRVSGRGAR